VTKGSAAYELRVCSLLSYKMAEELPYFLLLEHYGTLLVIFCCAQLFLFLFANLENSQKLQKGPGFEVAKRSNHLIIVIYMIIYIIWISDGNINWIRLSVPLDYGYGISLIFSSGVFYVPTKKFKFSLLITCGSEGIFESVFKDMLLRFTIQNAVQE
jgi:hypothetical protein